MERLKKGTLRYRLIRNCLIIHLAVVQKLKLPNVAEEAGVSIYTVRAVLKSYHNNDGEYVNINQLEERWAKQKRWEYWVKCLVSKEDPTISVKEIRETIRVRFNVSIPAWKILKYLKSSGYRWRRILPIQSYVNRSDNVKKRAAFARDMIELLEKGTNIINADECGFNCTSTRTKGWILKGTQGRTSRIQKITNTTLMYAITLEGHSYFSLIRGGTNQFIFDRFLRMLEKALNRDRPGWKKNSALLIDNCTIHGTPLVLATIDELKLPVKWSAAASFDAVPVE